MNLSFIEEAGKIVNIVAFAVEHLPSVGTSVKINLSLAQIGGDRVSGNEDGTSLEGAQILLQFEKVRLVSHAPSVNGILYSRDLLPGKTVITRPIDREVGLRGRVVLPCCKEDAVVLYIGARQRETLTRKRRDD